MVVCYTSIVQVGGEKEAFLLSTSMDGKMESDLSSSLTSNQSEVAARSIAHAATGLSLVRGHGENWSRDI